MAEDNAGDASSKAAGDCEHGRDEHLYCLFRYESDGLVLLGSSAGLQQQVESTLTPFLTKKVGVASHASSEGNVSVVELQSEDAPREYSCFYACMKKTVPVIFEANTTSWVEPVEGTTDHQYVVCLLSSGLKLDLFRPELKKFSADIIATLQSPDGDEQTVITDTAKSKLSLWPDHTVHYISRCLEKFQDEIGKLVYASILNTTLKVKSDDQELCDDIERFTQLCSLSDYFNMNHDTNASLEKTTMEAKNATLSIDSDSVHFNFSECPEYCQKLANDMQQCRAAPHLVKQRIENFKFMIFQDLNLFRRILNEAEQNYYALYRTYIFLSQLSYAPIILMHAKAHLVSNDAGLDIIQILEEHLNWPTAYSFSPGKSSPAAFVT